MNNNGNISNNIIPKNSHGISYDSEESLEPDAKRIRPGNIVSTKDPVYLPPEIWSSIFSFLQFKEFASFENLLSLRGEAQRTE